MPGGLETKNVNLDLIQFTVVYTSNTHEMKKNTVACTVAIASAVYLWRQTELDLFYCF